MTTTDRVPVNADPAVAPDAIASPGEPVAPASVDERQARQVAEAAREADWRRPSFGKELFLGRLRLDLIDPLPYRTRTAPREPTSSWRGCATSVPQWTVRGSSGRRGYRTRCCAASPT
jgi:hypothetical protein